jgi:hypothetical protein
VDVSIRLWQHGGDVLSADIKIRVVRVSQER